MSKYNVSILIADFQIEANNDQELENKVVEWMQDLVLDSKFARDYIEYGKIEGGK